MSRQAQLGFFAVLALALLFGIFYVVTDFGTRHSGYRIGVHFASAAGLPTGAQVFFSGVTVGTVDQIQLEPDNSVDVILAIQSGINIPKDSKFLIQAPLTGTPNLVIAPPVPRPLPRGYSATPLPAEAILPKEVQPLDQQPIGIASPTIADLLAQGQGEVGRLDTMLATLEQREPRLLDNLDTALANVDAMTTELRTTVADLSGVLDTSLRSASGNLVQMTSTVNSTLSRNQYKIDNMLTSLDRTAVALNKSMDALQGLATDPRLKNNLVTTTSNIRDLTSNIAGLTGDLRTITGNPQTQAQLQNTVANLDATMQKANSLLGTLGGQSHVYGVDAGATPYPVPTAYATIPPSVQVPGTQQAGAPLPGTPQPIVVASAPSRAGLQLSHLVRDLVEVQTRFTYLNAQSVKGPNPLLTSDRGPQTDMNIVILPRSSVSGFFGANDIGANTTWNFAAIKHTGPLSYGAGILYSQFGVAGAYNFGKIGVETRIYNLRQPTFDLYGNLNVVRWAQLFFGERDITRSDRRTVLGLQLQF